MLEQFKKYGKQFDKRGVLIDTNLLILLLIGEFDKSLVNTYKRLSAYQVVDFELLKKIIDEFSEIIYTPNILTEVTNLTDSVPNRNGVTFFEFVRSFLSRPKFSEVKVDSAYAMSCTEFLKVGLADSVNFILSDRYILLTVDVRLFSITISQNYAAINFNHLREIYL